MKALMLIGAKRNGTTDALCKQWEKGFLENSNNIVEKVYLFNKKMNGCIDCGRCRQTGKCIWNDDATEILNQILEADVIVLASPIYFYSITAQLKMILDRTFSIENQVKNKKIFFITSAAAPKQEPFDQFLDITLKTYYGFVECYRGELKDLGYIAGFGMAIEPDITKHEEYNEVYAKGKEIGNE